MLKNSYLKRFSYFRLKQTKIKYFNEGQINRIQNLQDVQKYLKDQFQKVKSSFENTYEIFQQNPQDKNYIYAILGILSSIYFLKWYLQPEYISFQDLFEKHIKGDNVLSIQINTQENNLYAQANLLNGGIVYIQLGSVDNFLLRLEQEQLQKGRNYQNFIPVSYNQKINNQKIYWYFDKIGNLFVQGLIITIILKNLQQLGQGIKEKKGFRIFGMGEKMKVGFNDVAGMHEVKTEISEFVDFLKNPQKYQKMGARLPKGALLTGPPGCGKTLLAKACAGEAGVPFLTMSGSDFVEMFVGLGASRVRTLFKQAKRISPCIIFIDEIDAIAGGGNDEKDNTLNQILVEMDGFGTDSQVIVMAATNRQDMLDKALVRPGRFDRQIEVNLPSIDEREEIFKIHLKPLQLDPTKSIDEYAHRLASLTPGQSGADIANLCNEAAILASRDNKQYVESIDFELASEKCMAGLQKKMNLSDLEKRTIAIHESGHAVISWFSPGCDPLVKITIIPRSKGSLGYAQYLPDENFIQTQQQLIDKLCFILGGRAAEIVQFFQLKVFFNKITTGASDDLQKVYDLTHQIVTKFGMSDLGNISFKDEEFEIKHSQETQQEIDQQIQKIVQECTNKSIQLIEKYKDKVYRLSEKLIEKETLNLKQITEILGEKPGKINDSFQQYQDQINKN